MNALKSTVMFLFFNVLLLAQNVSVSDYDVPISKATILRLNGTYNWAQSKNDTLTVVTANNASANLIFNSFYSSLPFSWKLDVNANGGKSYSDWTHDITIQPEIHKYIWDDKDWFGSAALFVEHANTFKQIESDITLGGGYGRYIDATALAKAVRIEEHLIKEGVVKDHMPKETMINIAKIINRESEFQGVYGATYEKEWYEAIEKEIRDSGYLVGNALGAIGILRMQEVLKGINEIVNPRFYGWDLQLGVLFNLSKQDKSPVDPPALALRGDFSYPIGWSQQIDAKVNVNTPFDSAFFKQLGINAQINYIYEFSNKINFVAAYTLSYKTYMAGNSYADHALTGSFVFYLENYINLAINANMVRSGLAKQTNLGSTVSLQYNFF